MRIGMIWGGSVGGGSGWMGRRVGKEKGKGKEEEGGMSLEVRVFIFFDVLVVLSSFFSYFVI